MKNDQRANGGRGPVIAIDGPVASGKSSVGKAAASILRLHFLDTGIMYRAVTWLALRRGERTDDAAAMGRLARECAMTPGSDSDGSAEIVVDGHALDRDSITSPEVDGNVSAVAAISGVRVALVEQQRGMASSGGIVMAGRDIGTVVLPDADVKLYIDASPEERARRRFVQQQSAGIKTEFEQVLADTKLRDRLDSERADSPLTVPEGALVIDTGGLDFDESVGAVIAAVNAAIGDRWGSLAGRE